MYRTLRAFAWMRWRIFVNSLERTGARDRLERFSIATEQLGPIMAAVLLVPAVIVLSGISVAAGYLIATESSVPLLFKIVRFVLLAVTALSIIGPVMLPAGDRTNAVRLLLLPISRATLYAAQAASTLSDPWVMLTVPIVVFVPIGLLAGGGFAGALFSLTAGLLLLATIVGLSTLATSALHLLMRDRRRAEMLALAFVVFMPLLGALPAVLQSSGRRHHVSTPRSHEPPPRWVIETGQRISAVAPSELFYRSATARTGERPGFPFAPLAGLGAIVLAVHAAGLFTLGRVLASPGTTGLRKAHAMNRVLERKLPLTSPAASAVALVQLRLAMRTPRGRSMLLSPLIVFVMFTVVTRQAGEAMDLGFASIQGGLGFATFGAVISMLVTLPVVMNQFAVDGAGLTLSLLLPLSNHDLLRGKAIGNALIALLPMCLCFAGALLLFGGGSPGDWLSIPLAVLATYLIVAPIAGVVSAMFPRMVDMNSLGRGSNAQGIAGLLGMASYVVGAAPTLLLVFLTSAVLRRPELLPFVLLLWCALATVISRLLFIPAERILQTRRENLALVV